MVKIIRVFILTSVFLSVGLFLNAQSDSSKYTSFSKGRSLVSLNGSIGSTTNNEADPIFGSDKVLNNYLIEARLAKIVARNFALGLAFSTEKYSSQQLVDIDTEILAIGPYIAYFLTDGGSGGLFIQASAFFVNYYEKNIFLAISPPIDEYSEGKGFAGAIGLGYTYVMYDRVGLEVSINFREARIYNNSYNNLQRTIKYEEFNRIDLNFRFGFVVLFNKVKK